MWLWIALAWCAVAVAAAALHRRWHRTMPQPAPEVAAFMLRFEQELAGHAGVVFLGLLPDRFACLLRVDGQETVVSLHSVFRHAEVQPDGFTRLVATLIDDIRDVGLQRVGDVDFAAAATGLLPQVRPRSWLERRGSFGDSGLVYTPLTTELVTVYVIDESTHMVFVCREHLRRWRKDVADLHNLAVANLAKLGVNPPRELPQEGAVLQSGDGFDAARVLLLGPRDGLLVAIPDRDTLWVGPEAGQNLEQLMATTVAISDHAAHPVSGQVFRVTDGRLEPVTKSR